MTFINRSKFQNSFIYEEYVRNWLESSLFYLFLQSSYSGFKNCSYSCSFLPKLPLFTHSKEQEKLYRQSHLIAQKLLSIVRISERVRVLSIRMVSCLLTISDEMIDFGTSEPVCLVENRIRGRMESSFRIQILFSMSNACYVLT